MMADLDIGQAVQIEMEIAKPVGGKHKLTFTGAVEAQWDGSEPVTVQIPQGMTEADKAQIIDETAKAIDLSGYATTEDVDALSGKVDNIHGMDIHICIDGEYDTETGQPTIQEPQENTFYLVPGGSAPDMFTEWIYTGGTWELFGSAKVDLSDYVKNTDYATDATPGVVQINQYYGVGYVSTPNKRLCIRKASTEDLKAGANEYKPVTPNNQHESTFYGLAKAAGDTTQSASSNAVGTYTDEAKAAIRQMLGVEPTQRIEKTAEDTQIELVPNILYVFPEMTELTITLQEPERTDIVNEYHFIFRSPADGATTLTIPDTVAAPDGFSVEAGYIYEISILESILCYQERKMEAGV